MKRVFRIRVHDVTTGTPGGRDDGYPKISSGSPFLFSNAKTAQREVDRLNAEPLRGSGYNGYKPRPRVEGEYGWYFVEEFPVFGEAEYAEHLEAVAEEKRKRIQVEADRLAEQARQAQARADALR